MRFQSLILTSLPIFILGYSFFGPTALAQEQAARRRIEYTPTHRVNAHGDEFNDLALSSDEQRLFVAGERGEVIVWNIAAKKIERSLRHEQPVHHVVALRDPRFMVAAGVKHFGENRQGFVRKWNVETEQFVDLPGLGTNFIVTNLAVDQKADVFAASSADGRVIAWKASDDAVLATWKLEQVPFGLAVVGGKLFVSTIQKSDVRDEAPATSSLHILELNRSQQTPPGSGKQVDKFIIRFVPSPDGRRLAVTSYKDYRESVEVLDLESSKYSAPLQENAATWVGNNRLLMYDSLDPSRVVSISAKGIIATQRKFPRLKVDDDGGRAFGLRGQVASRDGSRSWSVYDHQAWLIEWDLLGHKGKKLIGEPGGAFRLSVFPKEGEHRLVLTAGADGYVRLWRFSDLELQKEYHVAPAGHFVTEADFFPDGQRALVGTLPIRWKEAFMREKETTGLTNDYWLLNLATGEKKKWRSFDASSQRPTPVKVTGSDIAYIEQPKLVIASAESGLSQREFAVPAPFGFYSFSQNEKWLAVLDAEQTLHLFDARSTQLISSQKIQLAESTSPLAVTNDGRYVYVVSYDCVLLRWDTRTSQLTETVLKSLRDSHDHSDYITLSMNEEFLIVCGSHGDFGIYDTTNLDEVWYGRSGGTQYYVEALWLGGRRIIFTTDLGVMYAGTLSP